MKLWLLKARDDLPAGDDPWAPWYDRIHGYVIRAPSEAVARQMAQKTGKEETSGLEARSATVWLDPVYSTCTALEAEGEEEIVLIDLALG